MDEDPIQLPIQPAIPVKSSFKFPVIILVVSVLVAALIIAILLTNLTVPNSVDVTIASTIENDEMVLVLVLSAHAGSGCNSASDLKTKQSLRDNTLTVDIKGYRFNKGKDGVCPASITVSSAEIIVDPNWLKQGDDKEILFLLDGKVNRYKILFNNYKVTISSIKVDNVFTRRAGVNSSTTPVTLEMILYPKDVAVMRVSGYIDTERDYRPLLRNLAQEKGFIPAEEIYPELEQNDKTDLYVVLRNRPMPDQKESELLGELPDESISKIGTKIYLIRILSAAYY